VTYFAFLLPSRYRGARHFRSAGHLYYGNARFYRWRNYFEDDGMPAFEHVGRARIGFGVVIVRGACDDYAGYEGQ